MLGSALIPHERQECKFWLTPEEARRILEYAGKGSMGMINTLLIASLEGTIDYTGKPYTVTELARRAHITRAAAYKILKGISIPKVDTAIRIAAYVSECLSTEVTVEELWLVM